MTDQPKVLTLYAHITEGHVQNEIDLDLKLPNKTAIHIIERTIDALTIFKDNLETIKKEAHHACTQPPSDPSLN